MDYLKHRNINIRCEISWIDSEHSCPSIMHAFYVTHALCFNKNMVRYYSAVDIKMYFVSIFVQGVFALHLIEIVSQSNGVFQ